MRQVLTLLLALALVTGCSTANLRRSCIGAGAADAATTAAGISRGGTEANPLVKPAPAALSLVSAAVVIVAGDALRRSGHETAARWLYGGCAFVHGGAGAWNGLEMVR